MIVASRNTFFHGKSTPTEKDYVQDGIFALWDGINRGKEQYKWIDSSGNGNDLSLRSAVSVLTKNGVGRIKSNSNMKPVAVMNYSGVKLETLEMCITMPSDIYGGSQALLVVGPILYTNLYPCIVLKQGNSPEWSNYFAINSLYKMKPNETATLTSTVQRGYKNSGLMVKDSSDTWGFKEGMIGILGDTREQNYAA